MKCQYCNGTGVEPMTFAKLNEKTRLGANQNLLGVNISIDEWRELNRDPERFMYFPDGNIPMPFKMNGIEIAILDDRGNKVKP